MTYLLGRHITNNNNNKVKAWLVGWQQVMRRLWFPGMKTEKGGKVGCQMPFLGYFSKKTEFDRRYRDFSNLTNRLTHTN
jgi:hypothetical protein